MRWKNLPKSQNVEDRRHHRMSRGRRGGGIKLGGLSIIIALIIGFIYGPKNAISFLMQNAQQGQSAPQGQTQGQTTGTDIDDEAEAFVESILGGAEEVWENLLPQVGINYRAPKLILYGGATQMPGGVADSNMGPFYYPADETIYIDLSFFDDLANKYQAPGDFAQAYVLAHEVGHHVQHLLKLTDKVHSQRGRISQTEYNKQSVRLELQADYLAGVWAHHIQKKYNVLEGGDVEEALRAATAIGDDRLQKQSAGRVVPDSFTHGTSEQRVRWFKKGAQSGDLPGAMEAFTMDYDRL